MSTPKLESGTAAASADPAPRRGLGRRLTCAVGAAVVVTGVTFASAWLRDQGDDSWSGPTGVPSTVASVNYGLDLKAVQDHPRLIVDDAGWTVTHVYDLAETHGTIVYGSDAGELEMNWHPADLYGVFYEDRLEVSKPEAVSVAGVAASIFTYDGEDHAAMLKPRNGIFVELRATRMNRAGFQDLLSDVVRRTPETFLATLPPEVITPGEVPGAIAEVLTDVPIPPGFDVASIDVGGASYLYEITEVVTSQILCSWVAEWIRADTAADRPAVKEAAAVLRSSLHWKALEELAEGNPPSAVRRFVNKVADGTIPGGYRANMGCGR